MKNDTHNKNLKAALTLATTALFSTAQAGAAPLPLDTPTEDTWSFD